METPKRGRPKLPPGVAKTQFVYYRVRPAVKQRLEAAAREQRHSVPKEIERRIELSFTMEDVESYLRSREGKR